MADDVLYYLAKAIHEGKDPPRWLWIIVPSAMITGLLISKEQKLTRDAEAHRESPGDYANILHQVFGEENHPPADNLNITHHISLHDATIFLGGDPVCSVSQARINLELVAAWGRLEEMSSSPFQTSAQIQAFLNNPSGQEKKKR